MKTSYVYYDQFQDVLNFSLIMVGFVESLVFLELKNIKSIKKKILE